MARKTLAEMLHGVTRVGRLTVMEEAEPVTQSGVTYRRALCRCDCGTFTVVRVGNIQRQATVSCGCHRVSLNGERARRHGETSRVGRTPEYRAWQNMLRRCNSPKYASYHRYGGRGIKVCEAWTHSFEAFFADMGRKPSSAHSLDRENGDKDYGPDNCRWATGKEQRRNTSTNRYINYDGRRITIAELAEMGGLEYQVVHERLKRGWSPERALSAVRKIAKSKRHST